MKKLTTVHQDLVEMELLVFLEEILINVLAPKALLEVHALQTLMNVAKILAYMVDVSTLLDLTGMFFFFLFPQKFLFENSYL